MSVQAEPARRSVPAPAIPPLLRFRQVITSPNAIRTASVIVFFVAREYFGRQMNPIFMAPPSAIFVAAGDLWQSGALQLALMQTLLPFITGLVLTIVIGIGLGIAIAQWSILEYILDPFINAGTRLGRSVP